MFLFFSWQRCLVALWLLFATTVLADNTTTDASTVRALQIYIESALSMHPQLKAADATITAMQARADGLAQPFYNPELILNSERAQSNSYSVGLSQTFDLSGKRSARRTSGQWQLQQALAERDELRQQLVSDILAALADYRGKQSALLRAQQRLELLQRFADIAEQQYRAGDIGLLDRNLSQLSLAEAVANLGRAELEQLQARRALDKTTRRAAIEPPELPSLPPAPNDVQQDYQRIILTLPAIRAANARTEASVAQVDIARSNSHVDPTVTLSGGRETSPSEAGKALVGLQVSIPLFVRNNFSTEQAAASAEANAARMEANALTQQALEQLQASANQYRSSFAAWQRWRTATSNAIDNGIELLDKVWAAREINTAEYLMQLKQLLDGAAAGDELKYQTWNAWSEWLAASGQWQTWLNESASTALTLSSGK